MSLEEKAGSILMAHFHGEAPNEDARILIEEVHVGGIIYYTWANGLHSPQQVRALSEGLQALAQKTGQMFPLLIAADQEGGIVARLQEGFTAFPGNRAIGMAGDPDLARQSAKALGREMLSVGVNMNLAPVVDINCNPRNPVIGIRAFSDTAEEVAAFAEQSLEGFQQAGVLSCVKHFPGHGDTDVDSHAALPCIHKTREELERIELMPFRQLALQADAVMTAHVLVPAIDPDQCSTLSERTLGILRDEMGFSGAIVSDSLSMQGVLKLAGTIDEAAIRALQAGCDLLILGGKQLVGAAEIESTVDDIRRIQKSIVEAVLSGRVSQERLDEATGRVLALRLKCRPLPTEPLSKEEYSEHEALAQKIAALSLRSFQTRPLPIHRNRIAIIGPSLLQRSIDSSLVKSAGDGAQALYYNAISPSEEEIQKTLALAASADLLVLCSYNAWKFEGQQLLLHRLAQTGKACTLLCLRDPLDQELFPEADLVICTYSPTLPALEAACKQLF